MKHFADCLMLYSHLCRINTARERDRSHVSRQARDININIIIYIVITTLTATTVLFFCYTIAQHYMRRLRRRLRRAVPGGGGGGGVMTNPDVMLKYF